MSSGRSQTGERREPLRDDERLVEANGLTVRHNQTTDRGKTMSDESRADFGGRTAGGIGSPNGGLTIPRHFTKAGEDPFASVTWSKRTSRITNPDGSVVFEMKDAEVPAGW